METHRVPTRGYEDARGSLRAFAVQYRLSLKDTESPEAVEEMLRDLLDTFVEPYRRPGCPTLVIFPSGMNVPAVLAGPAGNATRRLAKRLPHPTPGENPQLLAGMKAVAAHYRQEIAAAVQRFGPLAPRTQPFIGAADPAGHDFLELFSRTAIERDLYLVAGAILPELAWNSETDTYSADGPEVYHRTFLWGPNPGGDTEEKAPWRRNLLFEHRNVSLTSFESEYLGISPGPVTGPEAIQNAAGYELAGFRFGFDAGVSAFGYGYPYGKRPEGFDPLDDIRANYVSLQDELGVDVLIQAAANPQLWAANTPSGCWQPLEWMGSAWRAVTDPTLGFRYSINAMLTGNLLDLPFDGQSSILGRHVQVDLGVPRYVGNDQGEETDPTWCDIYQGDKEEFLTLAPWVVPDAPREELRSVSRSLLGGSGTSLENAYVETAVYADLVPKYEATSELSSKDRPRPTK